MSQAIHKVHTFKVDVTWTGNIGEGTTNYTSYERAYEISAQGKPLIAGSADPVFRGDKSRYNPVELLVSSISACHMLWYLHLCADAHIIVTDYVDEPSGTMIETTDGNGRFTEVTLNPSVKISKESNSKLARELHEKAHHLCFIANSVNFTVQVKPTINVE